MGFVMEEETIGQRISKIRIQKGMSMNRLAQLSGLSPSHITRIEHVYRKPNSETIRKIAKALNVSPEELYGMPITLPPEELYGMPKTLPRTVEPETTQKQISKRIGDVLDNLGWSQSELARRTGLPTSTVSRVVSGKREADIVTLSKIATAFEVSVAYLTGESQPSAIDRDIRAFFESDWHKLSHEDRTWLRDTIDMLRRKLKELNKTSIVGKGGD